MIKKVKQAFLNPLQICKILICKIKSIYFSFYIDEGIGKIVIRDSNIALKINKDKGSKLILNGDLIINSHIGGNNPIVINLGTNAVFEIAGDFMIGNGVKIAVNEGAVLYFGGKNIESASGITADTIIMCYKKITIGKDFLCAWGVLITDSDWHSIGSQSHHADVFIGDHVWIANNSSVLKGSVIDNNSIVASQSKISNKIYSPNSLLAGVPAKVIKTDITWCRDIAVSNK